MGILRSDLIAHSSLATAGASVLFDGGDGNAGSTGLKTADSGNKYVIQGDTSELTIECWIYCTSIEQTFDTIWATNNYGVSGNTGTHTFSSAVANGIVTGVMITRLLSSPLSLLLLSSLWSLVLL